MCVPRDRRMPSLFGVDCPPEFRARFVQRTASPKCVARMSPVASVQPSPTTMISSARRV